MSRILVFLSIVLTSLLTSANDPRAAVVNDDFHSTSDFLDFLQRSTFGYMWEGAESTSGMARERIHLDVPAGDSDIITTGGSGFGIAGIIVAIDRGFITREEGLERLSKIVRYLAQADRFHGIWPHWIDGPTGHVKPFGKKDNGGDIVESSFLMVGLLIAREYFKDGNPEEQQLAADIDKLWREMEFDWYTRGGRDVIYWHWSPEYEWDMNFPLQGYNECLITYILAASSPTHPVSEQAYHNGWARSGAIVSDKTFMGLPLLLDYNGCDSATGPLFWAHYSYMGLNPKGLKDRYADYWQLTRNHALTNYRYCISNPNGYDNYGPGCWGLTASYSPNGYDAHSPVNDHGVITPTAALSSFPYTPDESLAAACWMYNQGETLRGIYGFYDAFSSDLSWCPRRYLAIDQLPIAPMIENYRSGLCWRLFMEVPEIQAGLHRLGFSFSL